MFQNSWKSWKPASQVCLALLCLVPVPYLLPTVDSADPHVERLAPRPALVDLNEQKEARYLLSLMNDYPDCRFTAKVLDSKVPEGPPHDTIQVAWGLALQKPLGVDKGKGEPAAYRQDDGGCNMVVKLLDCSIQGTDICTGRGDGLESVRQLRFPSQSYNPVDEWGRVSGLVTLDAFKRRD